MIQVGVSGVTVTLTGKLSEFWNPIRVGYPEELTEMIQRFMAHKILIPNDFNLIFHELALGLKIHFLWHQETKQETVSQKAISTEKSEIKNKTAKTYNTELKIGGWM